MSKQWVKAEIHKNELAVGLERATLWAKMHPQQSVWAGVAAAGALVFGLLFLHRQGQAREDAWSRLAVAQSMAYYGQVDQALAQVKGLGEAHPNSVASGYGLLLTGDVLFQAGRYKEAAQTYQQVVDRPNHKALLPLAIADLSLTLEAGGDCPAAMSGADRFLEAHPDHFLAPQVHAGLARCLAASGQAEKARSTYERIAFLYPETYWSEWAKRRLKG